MKYVFSWGLKKIDVDVNLKYFILQSKKSAGVKQNNDPR